MPHLLRQFLKKIPGARRARRAERRIRKAFRRRFGARAFSRRLAGCTAPHIVIGAGLKDVPEYIPTQIEYLNLLHQPDWERFFRPDSIAAILAEHVWEHLTTEEGSAAAATCFKYLMHGGYLRVAVPDGLHPSPEYQDWIRIGGASPMQGANDHKAVYTYRTLSQLFEHSGFRTALYE
jgi:predicted SAM-dependent methyltransferase